MFELVFYGRGGQGVVTASRLLAEAALIEGKYIQAFPEFGPERSGSPVKSYVRISDSMIETHSLIYSPDILTVIDRRIASSPSVFSLCKEGGLVVLNSVEVGSKPRRVRLAYVDARGIAGSLGSLKLENTAILGALARASRIVALDSLEKALESRFGGEMLEKNLKALREGFREVVMDEQS